MCKPFYKPARKAVNLGRRQCLERVSYNGALCISNKAEPGSRSGPFSESCSSRTIHFLPLTAQVAITYIYIHIYINSMRHVRMNVVFSSLQKLLPGIKLAHYTPRGLSHFLALADLPLNESGLDITGLGPL